MGLSPQFRADSPRERFPDEPVPSDFFTANVFDVAPPSPDEPHHSYRTLCAVRVLLEALDFFLLQREPFNTEGGRQFIQRQRRAIAAHVANLITAADHESALIDLDTSFGAKIGGDA